METEIKEYFYEHGENGPLKKNLINIVINSILFPFILIIYQNSYCQSISKKNTDINTWRDAIELSKLHHLLSQPNLEISNRPELLRRYKSILSQYEIENKNNYFLNELIGIQNIKGDTVDSDGLEGKGLGWVINLSGITKGLSNENSSGFRSKVAGTISTLMIERAKSELIHYSLNRLFQAGINDTLLGYYLFTLFPKSNAWTQRLAAAGVYYSTDLVILQNLSHKDMENLPLNMSYLLSKEEVNGDYLYFGNRVYNDLKDGKNTIQLINEMNSWKLKSPVGRVAKDYFVLFSNALRDTSEARQLYKELSIEGLSSNPNKWDMKYLFFYGLLMEQFKHFSDNYSLSMTGNLNDSKGSLAFVKSINPLLSVGSSLNKCNGELMSCKGEWGTDYGLKITEIMLGGYMKYLSSPIYKIDNTIMDQFHITWELERNTIVHVENKDYVAAGATSLMYIMKDNALSNRHLRITMFYVQLSAIKDENDFNNFLNAYTLPVGSSSVKRHSRFCVSLNGYFGLTGGMEGAQTNLGTVWRPNLGLSAPIGLSFTVKSKTTFFLSIFDLGSVFNARLNNDTTYYSNFTYKQIFAPGVGIFYNFKKSPITMGLHGCYVPEYRTIKYSSPVNNVYGESKVSVLRINFSILIDITFITFKNVE